MSIKCPQKIKIKLQKTPIICIFTKRLHCQWKLLKQIKFKMIFYFTYYRYCIKIKNYMYVLTS